MSTIWDRASAALFVLTAVLIAFTFRDYGLSWDEPFHIEYGARLLRFYATAGRDSSAFDYINLYFYGGVFDAPVAWMVHYLPFGLIDNRHLLIALVGLGGVVGTWRLGRLLAGARGGFFAALLLLSMPGWYGHMFINPKDIPFATAMIWATYYLARLSRRFDAVAWRDVLLFGLCSGMALGLRIGGVLLLVYLAIAAALWLGWEIYRRQVAALLWRQTASLVTRLTIAVSIAYGVMVLAWPWALSAPLMHPYQTLTTFANFPLSIPVLFDGVRIMSTALPLYYLPHMMAVKVPLLHWLLLAALATLWWRQRVFVFAAPALPLFVTLTALVFPVAYVLATRPVLYNEMRHFLFLLPPLAVLSAVGLELLWRSLPVGRRWLQVGITVALAGWVGNQVTSLYRLHPYEYVAYNAAVGGVGGAEGRYELDYWSTSARETYALLKDWLRAEGGEAALHRPWRIRLCAAPEASLYYLEPEWRPLWLGNSGEADFEVGSDLTCGRPTQPLLIAVRRDGALLGYVRDLRK